MKTDLPGKNISFRNLQYDDRFSFYKWIKDENVIKYSLSVFQTLKTEEQIDKWFHTVLNDENSFTRAILFNNSFLGYAGISSISRLNNYGEYFIFIGDRGVWNSGIGSYVTTEIIKIGFDQLLLNRISLTVSDENIYAFKAYKKAGFIEEGCMREACFRNGYYHNKILMSIIREDLEK